MGEPTRARSPRYRFVSPWPEVFADLEVGRGARVFPAEGRPAPLAGAPVVLLPGDEIELELPSDDIRLRPVTGPAGRVPAGC